MSEETQRVNRLQRRVDSSALTPFAFGLAVNPVAMPLIRVFLQPRSTDLAGFRVSWPLREMCDLRVTARWSGAMGALLLLALAASFGCREPPFPNRHVAQLGSGETREILEVDMESTYCTLQYLSDIELNQPEAAKRRAHEILLSYLDAQPAQVSCETIVLLPTEWRDGDLWRALELAAERDADGTWSMQ